MQPTVSQKHNQANPLLVKRALDLLSGHDFKLLTSQWDQHLRYLSHWKDFQ